MERLGTWVTRHRLTVGLLWLVITAAGVALAPSLAGRLHGGAHVSGPAVIDNAVRYAQSRVRISASGADGRVRVDITDDGPGIPTGERKRVFDRFVRLDASREHLSGSTGLGLAIAKEIVTAHQGTITIDSPDEDGTVVTVILPCWV